MNTLLQFLIRNYSTILKEIKVDALVIWEDMSGKQGSLMSPKHFKEFISPRYKELIKTMKKFGVIDLCFGMGGLSYAARESGLDVWAGVDTSKSALNSFIHNFPRASAIYGDVSDRNLLKSIIREIQSKRKHNKKLIVISGPPCQGFSDAGPRRAGTAEAATHLRGTRTHGSRLSLFRRSAPAASAADPGRVHADRT